LKLFPASKYSDPLRCQLFTVNFSRAPRYRALSYVWGDGTKTHNLCIINENQTPPTRKRAKSSSPERHPQIPITSSLTTALRHLRSLPTIDPDAIPIIIWIDQICINQLDNNEKSHQVQLMGQIYSRAMEVLVWLGPAADGSDEVMDALGGLAREWAETVEKVLGGGYEWTGHVHEFMRQHWWTEEEKGPGQEAQNLFARTLRTVIKLQDKNRLKKWYTRAWFTRIWTIQNSVSARTRSSCAGARLRTIRPWVWLFD
ncbi:heterokaryon incompatibility protein-domain-containing protein, partial [Pseudoneurospora amorphoporcata]